MTWRVRAAAAGAIVGIVVLLALWQFLGAGRPGAGEPGATSAPGSSPTARAEPARATAESRANPKNPAAARETAAAESKPAADDASLGEIRGRFVREGGAPAVGLDVELGAWPPDSTRERTQFSRLPKISDRRKTDSEGRFSFRFAPNPILAFWVKGTGLGLESYEWRCQELAPGETKDLGTIVLREGAVVVGRLVDRSGRPLATDWLAEARSTEFLASPTGKWPPAVKSPVDPATGAFRLEGIPPGPVQVGARLFAEQKSPVFYAAVESIQATPGRESHVELAFDGESLASKIRVFTRELPAFEMVRGKHATLRGESIEPRVAQDGLSEGGGFTSTGLYFIDLPQGKYSLEIRHPAYQLWKREGIEPGPAPVRAELVGNAAIRVRVVDDAGDPVDAFGLDLTYSLPWYVGKFWTRLRWEDDPAAPVPWTFPMVPLERFTITAFRFGGRELAEAVVEKLAAGETREVTIRFEKSIPQMWFAGRVVEADGSTPAANEMVGIFVPAEEQDSPASPYVAPPVVTTSASRCRTRIAEARVDERGIFRSPSLKPGRYFARVVRGAGLEAVAEVELRAGEESPEPLLTIPRGAYVSGRMLGLEASALSGARVRAEVLDPKYPEARRDLSRGMMELKAEAAVSTDGAYRVGPLPAGKIRLTLVFEARPPMILATLDIVGEADVTRDFELDK